MSRFILLDSAPMSLLAKPATTVEVQAIAQWATECLTYGWKIVIPEIVDYEVRRELLRAGRVSSVNRLDGLKARFDYLPLTTDAMRKAAELWAEVRQKGLATAPVENIDIDVILAAQALTCGVNLDDIVVATSNPRHLTRFIAADLWRDISPDDSADRAAANNP